MNEPLPCPQLYRAFCAGDPNARDSLVEIWGPVVLRWCRRLGGPGIEPEDIAHDVFVQMFSHLDSLREPEAFPGWIFAITRREIQRHRRRAWFRLRAPWAARDGREPAYGPEQALAQARLARQVQQALEALSPKLRETLILCDLEERTDEAVAALLGIPVGTVKSRLRRARRAFEQEAISRKIPRSLAEEGSGALPWTHPTVGNRGGRS